MKRKRTVLPSLALILTLAARLQAIEINEIRIDQPSNDNDEYFELVGTPGESLDLLTYLVIGDGPGGSGVVEAVIGLAGQTIPSDGFFLAAEDTFSLDPTQVNLTASLNFENSDNVTHVLVSGYSGGRADDLDEDDDGSLDVTPWESVLDAVSLVHTLSPGFDDEYFYAEQLGGVVLGPDGSLVPGHVYREANAGSPFAIGPFDLPPDGVDTPGRSNVPVPPLVGDFNGDTVLDASDINALSSEARSESPDLAFDLTGDGRVDADDRLRWVHDLKLTYLGDANLDGEFNTTDFVQVFQQGEYEDGVVGNSLWETGDWNGDSEFDTGDFVVAFQDGGFERGPRGAVGAVPEPAAALVLVGALGCIVHICRQRMPNRSSRLIAPLGIALACATCRVAVHAAEFTIAAVDVETVRPAGPRDFDRFFNIEGRSNGTNSEFASFGVADFNTLDFGFTRPVANIRSGRLLLVQANAQFTTDGPIDFYVTQNVDTSIQPDDSPLFFDVQLLDGLGSQLDPKTKAASGEFRETKTGDTDIYPLNLSSVTSYLIDQINNKSFLRIVITPADDAVAATYAGSTHTAGGPMLVLDILFQGEGMPGDLDGNRIVDAQDIDLLSQAVRMGTTPEGFDLDDDGDVDDEDRRVWVEERKKTWFGDANLDSVFDTTDLVHVFQAGRFETQQAANWSQGDWNGDGRFDSADFVIAFRDGGFERGPRAAVAVPEPSGCALVARALVALVSLGLRERKEGGGGGEGGRGRDNRAERSDEWTDG